MCCSVMYFYYYQLKCYCCCCFRGVFWDLPLLFAFSLFDNKHCKDSLNNDGLRKMSRICSDTGPLLTILNTQISVLMIVMIIYCMYTYTPSLDSINTIAHVIAI